MVTAGMELLGRHLRVRVRRGPEGSQDVTCPHTRAQELGDPPGPGSGPQGSDRIQAQPEALPITLWAQAWEEGSAVRLVMDRGPAGPPGLSRLLQGRAGCPHQMEA